MEFSIRVVKADCTARKDQVGRMPVEVSTLVKAVDIIVEELGSHHLLLKLAVEEATSIDYVEEFTGSFATAGEVSSSLTQVKQADIKVVRKLNIAVYASQELLAEVVSNEEKVEASIKLNIKAKEALIVD